MTIKASIILHSVNPAGVPLITANLYYPRVVHAEHLRHRCFSFSVSSSRAIPVERLIGSVETDPYIPTDWRKAQKGMVGGEPMTEKEITLARYAYDDGLRNALTVAKKLANIGAAKQIVNRILEPYSHVNVIVTGTDWANFFALRRHPDAEPNMREIANKLYYAVQASGPEHAVDGAWHYPCLMESDYQWVQANYPIHEEDRALGMISAARCAGGSYTLEGVRLRDPEKDMKLGLKMVEHRPLHSSPFEHSAQSDSTMQYQHQHGNLFGWRQLRKLLPDECVLDDYAY